MSEWLGCYLVALYLFTGIQAVVSRHPENKTVREIFLLTTLVHSQDYSIIFLFRP